MKHSEEFMKGWLRGIFDGEGTVFFRGKGTKDLHAGTHVSMSNTDKTIIDTCQGYLTELGIYCIVTPRKRLCNPHWKPIWNVCIYRNEDVIKFAEKVGFVSPAKAEKLSSAVVYINRQKTKYDIKELARMHWDEKLSYRKIADKYGLKSGTTIKQVFDRYEIPRRNRLEGLAIFNHSK